MMVLPTTYLGSVEWYRRYFTNPQEVQIEVMESFPKQTYRNRCTISQAIGRKGDEARGWEPLTLSVPVKRADSKQLTRDVEISYQQKWQHQHWIALVSTYKRTPYFDYYADFFRPFYEQETRFLVDFNEKIHEVIVRLVQNSVELGRIGQNGKDSVELGRIGQNGKDSVELGRIGQNGKDSVELGRIGQNGKDSVELGRIGQNGKDSVELGRIGQNGVELYSEGETTLRNTTQLYTTEWMGLDLEPCFGDGQSILDLLFEYGPETPVVLGRMV